MLAPVSYDMPVHASGMIVVDLQRVLSCSSCGMAIDTLALALRIPVARQGAVWAADRVAWCAHQMEVVWRKAGSAVSSILVITGGSAVNIHE